MEYRKFGWFFPGFLPLNWSFFLAYNSIKKNRSHKTVGTQARSEQAFAIVITDLKSKMLTVFSPLPYYLDQLVKTVNDPLDQCCFLVALIYCIGWLVQIFFCVCGWFCLIPPDCLSESNLLQFITNEARNKIINIYSCLTLGLKTEQLNACKFNDCLLSLSKLCPSVYPGLEMMYIDGWQEMRLDGGEGNLNVYIKFMGPSFFNWGIIDTQHYISFIECLSAAAAAAASPPSIHMTCTCLYLNNVWGYHPLAFHSLKFSLLIYCS